MRIITHRDAPEEAMTLARDQVTHVAMLARLGLSDEEVERYRQQLDAILSHVDRLQQVDTSQVGETAQVGGLVNAWREDVRGECLPVEKALANAPKRRRDHFEVGAIQE
jgi:aspartyl-tRNA(Asn)/glutamyl-tRNA(Gln) amidotransferase subunit C